MSAISNRPVAPLLLLVAITAAGAARVSAQTTTEPSQPSATTPAQSETPQPGGALPSQSGAPATQPTPGATPTPGPAQPAIPATADLAAVLTPKAGDTPAVKQFKESGKNPYNQDPKAIVEGFKLARASACTHCHGESLGGLIGPSLANGNWRHVRNRTDKGMFETLYFGTSAGMAAWGKSGSLTEDEILKIIAFVRSKYRGDPKGITWE